ncbi:MAG: alpha/beta hydrolase fold domain-containing protein [Clostridiales bacterium]|nr:alpha/beta hydrolase fold domain-containing protein [Clostridiales bacterium]
MALSAKAVRAQLNILKPLLNSCSRETLRKGQNKLGELMEFRYRREVIVKEHPFERFGAAWVLPRDERRQGVILYLHGGGYVCGDLEYAKGFASTLAAKCGIRVFCAGYRLAPEHPYPAALEDALQAYRYLLDKGYTPSRIALCGESAGGGLCYALCMKLREAELPQPGSIIAISPWTDLTASGPSYEANKEADPSMSVQALDYYAGCYCTDREDPYVSPVFGDLQQMPPSLIFAGGDEIMRSDSVQMHEKLKAAGRKSKLIIRPERWHAYVLYGLKEDAEDFKTINNFLSAHVSEENKLRWMRLDNAAKIYPAARSQNWSNVFRLSVTLAEPVDVPILQAALDVTVRRFPSIAARLRRGVFWYYIQQLQEVPQIRQENSYPLAKMSRDEVRRCAIRVIVYHKRIAVELFHSLTDGNGALVFLKTLTAEYLQQKYGVRIPAELGVLGRLEEPSAEELEDSFQKYAGKVSASRRAADAWHIRGTPEPDDFLHVTCLQVPVEQALEKAHAYGVSLTAFLCAVMMQAIQNLQKQRVPNIKRRRHVKVLIPVNLRRLFPSKSLRNFVLYTTPEIDPRLGEYTFEEICAVVRSHMGLEINAKFMSSMIATNVNGERPLIIRIMPLFIKNAVMKMIFNAVGERKSCLCLSNLGAVELPEQMRPYVERFDFVLGVQAKAPYNCGVLSYGGTLFINFIRNIQEPALEYHFHCVLRDLGVPVQVESNSAGR